MIEAFFVKYGMKYVLPAVLAALALSILYNWVYERGRHSRDKEVAGLEAAYQSWKGYGQAEAKLVAEERAAHAQALKGLQSDQKAIVEDLGKKLDAAEARARKNHITPTEVVRYVSAKSDAAFHLPFGFLRLHNAAAGRDQGAPEASAVPRGGWPDADAASDTALSTVGATIADNYAECTARGEVIRAWQDWYPRMKSAWDRAVQVQLAAPDTMPAAPTGATP
jgi:hypothetical protein